MHASIVNAAPRSFDDAAELATATTLPVPRAVAFRHRPATLATASAAVAAHFTGWLVEEVEGLPGWFSARPAEDAPSLLLGEFWARVRTLRSEPGVVEVDPLFLIANPAPATDEELAAFGLGPGQEQFGLWGARYDEATRREKARLENASDWHLKQLGVPAAWDAWRQQQPGKTPGDGVRIGHPDTGFTEHHELAGRFQRPGRSFVRDEHGAPEPDARDDLQKSGLGVLQQPGHGTATASVIASGDNEREGNNKEVYGVAPGATILPLRVSRSVIHIDFDVLRDAILHAVEAGVDVISMSLGGPLESSSLRAAIQKAREEGVIVVAAAGNMIPTTVFPAAFPEVIAVAATHAASGPWRHSGLGPLVDIAAPGEDVWCARASMAASGATFRSGQGTGTSFATACVAGLAALWLSYHGGRSALAAHYGRPSLVPVAFQYLLARTASNNFDFVRRGRHGAGIPDAARLLAADLPSKTELERFERVLKAQGTNVISFITGLFSGWLGVSEASLTALAVAATIDDAGKLRRDAVEETEAVERAAQAAEAERRLLGDLLGDQRDDLTGELLARIATDRALMTTFQRWRQGASLLPLLDRLLIAGPALAAAGDQRSATLSSDLQAALATRREQETMRLQQLHQGRLTPDGSGGVPPDGPPPPAYRQLRAYAFDPSLETELESAPINQVIIPTRWETLRPGPLGEYLEVVDVDPASGCAYAPVNLDHPHILAQDGLPPSEGDPQFHQQMVYAVAMNTIHRCELALGRPIFWAPLRPWLAQRAEDELFTPESIEMIAAADARPRRFQTRQRDRYVQRLRIYPHALREANAYYSPSKRALLFGYFPAREDDPGKHYPGGTVFTCLSHDIVAHETTHALLDGMHPYYNEPSNEDVLAFHEAFADILALFQKFTYPEVIRHQIANTRGDLDTHSLLGQLAQQFGLATTGRHALRDALGGVGDDGEWKRRTPNARALSELRKPHERGGILVAAVFDAFIALYNERIADLRRIASGGSGILPAGRLHPDLVNRLADEAAQTAEEVLRTCIRALDYVPPVDITFGEFLRALITADYDLAPTEHRKNRIAFIDAFRSWGIYPRDVPTLSEDSLRWRGPGARAPLSNLMRFEPRRGERTRYLKRLETLRPALEALRPALETWQPRADPAHPSDDQRRSVFYSILDAQASLHQLLEAMQAQLDDGEMLLPGLDLRDGAAFSVANLRPARRIGPLGEFLLELVVEVVQTYRPPDGSPRSVPFRGGATLVVDLRSWDVRYVIYKRLYEQLPERVRGEGVLVDRHRRHLRFDEQRRLGAAGAAQALWQGEDADLEDPLAVPYVSAEREAAGAALRDEPFALVHRGVRPVERKGGDHA